MGSSRPFSEEKSRVEHTSLTEVFEKLCPIYMSYGMSYNDFWFGSPYMTKFYKEAHDIVAKKQDENNWMMGVYVYEALCDVSPILHAFSKRGTKPLPYRDKPLRYDESRDKTEEEKEREIEAERLKFTIQMNNWFRATKKQFENKQ